MPEKSLTRAHLVARVMIWKNFNGPLGLEGEFGKTWWGRDVLWITRVPSDAREDGYAYTIFDRAAWEAFDRALVPDVLTELLNELLNELKASEELAHAQ